jgi:hypothetical protein
MSPVDEIIQDPAKVSFRDEPRRRLYCAKYRFQARIVRQLSILARPRPVHTIFRE